jgi:CHAT domain-containing protein/tetratricopeptide (TPR) repeat protein
MNVDRGDVWLSLDQNISSDLRCACALLRWFDRALLHELVGCGEGEVAALLGSDVVEPAPDAPGAYRLHDEARRDALMHLRAERPADELTWQRHIFEHFLRRMQECDGGEALGVAEDECFLHLAELFLQIAARHEWQTLAGHVAAARAASPRRIRHVHQLLFYEAYVAVRTQQHERGKAILTALLDEAGLEDDLRMQALNALGQVYWFQTHYDRALTLYQQVHALAQRIGNFFYQAAALGNIGMIYKQIGQYERALALTSESLKIFHELGDSRREAQALYEIGNYAIWLGRWQDAQDHFRQAITLYEAVGIQAGLAYLYWGQGFLNHLLDDVEASEIAYHRALEISRSPEHGELSVTMDCWIYLGLLYQTQNRWSEALSAYEQALERSAQIGNQHWLSLVHYRRGNVFERQGRLDAAMAAYRTAIEGIEALRGDTKVEEIKIGLLGTIQQVYESAVLLCLARGQNELAFDYVERARSRAFLDLLADKRTQAGAAPAELSAAIAQPVVTLAEVQAALPDGALLIEYYTTGVLPRGEALINKIPPENTRVREHLALPPRVVGFAVTRDGLHVFFPALDPNTLRPQPADPGPGRRLLRERLLAHLHEQLLAPVAPLLAGRRLLYLVPHGPLHYVPFMALRSAAGEHLLRGEGPAIALAPAATILLRNCLQRRRGAGGAALALGYNDAGDDALRYAEAEAGHVARLAGGAALLGPAPKRTRLAEAGRQVRWLHVAGHAIYDPHDPLGSYLKLGAGEQLSAREIMGELELRADLVTLSACMSGVTHVVPGDELLGLQRAFLYAGAPAVVCTLWEAADMVALLVMDHFYEGLKQGQAPAAALRDAQVAAREMTGRGLLAALDRWRSADPALVAALGELPEVPDDALDAPIYADPLYWAPFMLIGRGD